MKYFYLCLMIFLLFFDLGYSNPCVVIWTQVYDSGNMDTGKGIAVDKNKNVFVTGVKDIAGVNPNMLTIKYSPQGQSIWTQELDTGPGRDDRGEGIVIDSQGNIYVAGRWQPINWDYYIVKYNNNGQSIWTQTYDAGGAEYIDGICIDKDDNIYVTGWDGSFYTVKYDPAGNTIWSQQFSIPGSIDMAIAVDSEQNSYVTGPKFIGFLEYFTFKMDISGNTVWSQDSNIDGESYGIAVDSGKNVYVTGKKGGDIFTIKYDTDGNTIWTQQYINGLGNDSGNTVNVDSYNNVYVVGEKSNGVNGDFFIIKYDPDGNILWTQQNNFSNNEGFNALFIDEEHAIYGTGTRITGPNWDYYTIKYIQPPYTPVLLSAALLSSDAVELSWQDIPNEDEFIVLRSIDGITFTNIGRVIKDQLFFIDSDIGANTVYYYRLAATNIAGLSLPSNILNTASHTITTLKEVVVSPNPFKPYTQGIDHVTFHNLSSEFEIRVYTTGGGEVFHKKTASVSGRYQWDVKNNNGELLKSGVYVCFIKNGKEEKYLKLVVIR